MDIMVEYSTNPVLLGLTIEQLGIIFSIGLGLAGIRIARKAMNISYFSILPDIEYEYILKDIDLNYLKQHKEYKENFDFLKTTFGTQYSHLILVNNGNGKASNIDVAYNWDLDYGYSSEYTDYELSCKDELSKGEEIVDIPAIDIGINLPEEAQQILIRIKYKDSMGTTYCKCKYFLKEEEGRRYNKINKYCKTCHIGLLKKIGIKLLGGRCCHFEEK